MQEWHQIRTFSLAIVLVLAQLGLCSSAAAQNLLGQTTSGLFGFKAGMIGRMNLSTEPPLQSRIGSTAQVFAYFPMGNKYHLTAAFDFYYIRIVNSHQIMIEPNMGFRRSFPLGGSKIFLAPGASLGFAFLADMGDIHSSQYLSFKLSLEARGIINTRTAWVAELAVFDTPTGNSGIRHLTFGPGLLVRAGFAFR